MNCDVLPLCDLDDSDLTYIRRRLTKPGSDFHKKLRRGELEGQIAIVRDQGEIIGWARTEPWVDCSGDGWDTLEAFVAEEYRHRGIASFAACGLEATGCLGTLVAVFHPAMYIVGTRAGIRVTLFSRGEAWVQA
jgi:hypothetical protein